MPTTGNIYNNHSCLMFNHHYNLDTQTIYNCHQLTRQSSSHPSIHPAYHPSVHLSKHSYSHPSIYTSIQPSFIFRVSNQQTCWLMCLINKIVSFGLSLMSVCLFVSQFVCSYKFHIFCCSSFYFGCWLTHAHVDWSHLSYSRRSLMFFFLLLPHCF